MSKILICVVVFLVANPLAMLLASWAAFWIWFAANFIVAGKE